VSIKFDEEPAKKKEKEEKSSSEFDTKSEKPNILVQTDYSAMLAEINAEIEAFEKEKQPELDLF